MSLLSFVLVTEPDVKERLDRVKPPFRPAGNLKDELKKQEDVKEKERVFLENAHLSPLTGRVAGYAWFETETANGFDYAASATEEVLIGKIGTLFLTHDILTYDGKNFDFPFLASRASLYESTQKYVETFAALFHSSDTDWSRGLPTDTLTDVAEWMGLSFWQAPNPFTRKNVLSLKELAGFYQAEPAPVAFMFANALRDFRKEGVPPDAKADELGEWVQTENQKMLHKYMGDYLLNQVRLINDLSIKMGRDRDE
jgi:hypothetical protein